jgi:dephospho-CoA kinase
MTSHPDQVKDEQLVIGITGRIGSGKTSVGKYLSSAHEFQYLRYSQILALWREQDPENKAALQEAGWKVMGGGMQTELNRRLIAQIKPHIRVAVDGLRHPIDYETLGNSFSSSFKLLYIDSPPEERFRRLNEQGKYSDFASFETADQHLVEQHIESLRAHATTVIDNRGSLEDLYADVNKIIRDFAKVGHA